MIGSICGWTSVSVGSSTTIVFAADLPRRACIWSSLIRGGGWSASEGGGEPVEAPSR